MGTLRNKVKLRSVPHKAFSVISSLLSLSPNLRAHLSPSDSQSRLPFSQPSRSPSALFPFSLLPQLSFRSLFSLCPSFSLTTFSPSGKLVQIEHALTAVGSGQTSLGIKDECNLNWLMLVLSDVT
ncbi:hypothetical protein ACLB2K_039587 [Fragaria x ananassa]